MEEKRNDRPKKTELYLKNMPLRNRGGGSSKDLTRDPITPKLME